LVVPDVALNWNVFPGADVIGKCRSCPGICPGTGISKPGGDLLVSEPKLGKFDELVPDKSGTAGSRALLRGLTEPQGTAFAKMAGHWAERGVRENHPRGSLANIPFVADALTNRDGTHLNCARLPPLTIGLR
jgi:hypothetical protein